MRTIKYIMFFGVTLFSPGISQETPISEFATVSQVDSGIPVSVMLTSYSTTLLANGQDQTRLRIAITDSSGREITSASDSVLVYVIGNGKISSIDDSEMTAIPDTSDAVYYNTRLVNGVRELLFIAGDKPDKIQLEARSGKLWPGGHEIHTIAPDIKLLKPQPDQLRPANKTIDRMIGADISFLPQIESRGRKFFDNGMEKDAIKLLRDHGFNYIRLRIFVNPENREGYAPGAGFCGLDYTLQMANRIHDAGMKLLLDFHYSDTWADPQKQFKPKKWADLDFETLKDSMMAYTTKVLLALKQQGTMPAMVQIGNEINHGLLWPEGYIQNMDQLADLLKAGVQGVNAVDANLPVMMHIALGGQNKESVFWLDNMIARGVPFDIIGISYYSRWHGTLDDLKYNLHDLVKRYNKPVNVVEYSGFKREVHDIVFGLPANMGKGACIWEPLGWRSRMFNRNGETTGLISIYDELKDKYLPGPDQKK